MASSNVPFKSALDSFLDRRNEASDREVKYAQLIQQARIQNEQLAIQQSQERRGIVQQGQNMRLNEINMRGAIDANARANSSQGYADYLRLLGQGNLEKQNSIQGFKLGVEANSLPMDALRFELLKKKQLFDAEYNYAFSRKDTARLKELTGKAYFVDDQDRVYFEGIGADGSKTKMYANGNTQEQQQLQDQVKTDTAKSLLGMVAPTASSATGTNGTNAQPATGFDPTRFASPSTTQNTTPQGAPLGVAGTPKNPSFSIEADTVQSLQEQISQLYQEPSSSARNSKIQALTKKLIVLQQKEAALSNRSDADLNNQQGEFFTGVR